MKSTYLNTLKEAFNRDGYVSIPGFLSAEEMIDIHHRLDHFIREKVPAMTPQEVFYEDKQDATTLKQLINIHNYDPYFGQILAGSRFEDLAAGLLGEGVIPKTLEYFNKPPKIGKPTPPHQDAYYFMITPQQATTMWLAMEDVDEENGCVRYVRGSHKHGMRPHGRTRVAGFSQSITDFGLAEDKEHEVPFPAKAGDLLVHHAMTIHHAEGNTSTTRSRRAMGLIYFGESAREDVEAKRAYQLKLREESTFFDPPSFSETND